MSVTTPRGFRAAGKPDLFQEPRHNTLIQVVASKTGVTVGGEHLEHSSVQLEYRKVERPATQVIDSNPGPVSELVQSVGQSRGRRLIHNPLDGEPS